ncbi:MAG: TrmB family transcriptional regulator [Candidatus Hydrothermarchaeota archaeon]
MDIEESLVQLGLNRYEVKTYLAILKSSEISAPSISNISGVPFSRIYDTLSSLERIGLVECKLQRPKLYRASDPSIAIENLLKNLEKKQKKELEYKSRIAKKILPSLVEIYNEKSEADETIWTIRGNENVMKKIDEIVPKTREILRIAGKKPFFMLECGEVVEKAALKGVKIKAIGEFNPECIELLNRIHAKYKEFQFMYQYLLIGDEKFVLIVVHDQSGIPLGIYSENADFVKANLELFERMWKEIE